MVTYGNHIEHAKQIETMGMGIEKLLCDGYKISETFDNYLRGLLRNHYMYDS